MSDLSVWQWLMLVIGAGLATAALTALWGPRIAARRDPRANDARSRAVEPQTRTPLGMTEPTRLSVGIVLLVWAYHMVVWALPAAWGVNFAIPVHLWPWVLGGGVVWAGGSLLMDARERASGGDGGTGPDRDPN